MRSALLLLIIALLFTGCGYHVQGRQSHLPPDVKTVFIELFENRTLEPFVENILSNHLSERISRGRGLHVAGAPERSDAVLSGTITAYQTSPISYDPQDRILEYRSTMTASALLRRTSDGQVVWRATATWTQEYPASPDKSVQEVNESAAIRVISERLADELYARLVANF